MSDNATSSSSRKGTSGPGPMGYFSRYKGVEVQDKKSFDGIISSIRRCTSALDARCGTSLAEVVIKLILSSGTDYDILNEIHSVYVSQISSRLCGHEPRQSLINLILSAWTDILSPTEVIGSSSVKEIHYPSYARIHPSNEDSRISGERYVATGLSQREHSATICRTEHQRKESSYFRRAHVYWMSYSQLSDPTTSFKEIVKNSAPGAKLIVVDFYGDDPNLALWFDYVSIMTHILDDDIKSAYNMLQLRSSGNRHVKPNHSDMKASAEAAGWSLATLSYIVDSHVVITTFILRDQEDGT